MKPKKKMRNNLTNKRKTFKKDFKSYKIKMSAKFLLLINIFIIYSFFLKMPKNSIIKIMCVGDSITDGHLILGSYRKFLYHNLIQKGYKIKMVGAKDKKIEKYYDNKNKSEYFEYENDNTGYCGYTICSFGKRKGIFETLKKKECLKLNPDIIILQIGTNNVMQNYDFNKTINDFISLIDYMLHKIPKYSIIFVATIPDMDPNKKKSPKRFQNYRKDNLDDEEVKNNVNKYVMKFNNEIKRIVEDYKNKKYNIRIGDLNPLIKDIDNLLYDGIHPTDEGYKIMANFWADNILKYLNEKVNII